MDGRSWSGESFDLSINKGKRLLGQVAVKGACQLGVLRNKHILIRCSLWEDFVSVMTKNSYYIKDRDSNIRFRCGL